MRLTELEGAMHEIASAGGAGGASTQEVVEAQKEIVSAAFGELAGRIEAVEARGAGGGGGGRSEADDVYLRNKIEEQQTEIADLKRVLLKVQSFAMETNCNHMKLAARVEKDVETAIAKQRVKDAEKADEARSLRAWEETVERRVQEIAGEAVAAAVASVTAHQAASSTSDHQATAEDQEAESADADSGEDGAEEVHDEVEAEAEA